MDRELEKRLDRIDDQLLDIKMMLIGLEAKPTEKSIPRWSELVEKHGATPIMTKSCDPGGLTMKKPIMYLYNFSGDTLNCNVDFKSNIVIDSVPEIRKDNKIVFSLDSDSFIDNKYSYLYYEFEIVGNEPKSSSYTFVKNNKSLDYDLERLCSCLGFNNAETIDFIAYWSLELKRIDTPFFKCEIFDENKLEKLFPIEVDPVPEFFVRRYVKFSPADKLGRGNITSDQFRPKTRMGRLRIFEWGGYCTGDKKVH